MGQRDNKGDKNLLARKDDTILCQMEERHGQQTIEYVQSGSLKSAFNSSRLPSHQRKRRISSRDVRPDSKGDARLWHLRLGHPGPMSLHHLGINALGVKALRRRNVNIAVSPKSNDRSHEGRRNGISINPISTSIFEPSAPHTQAQNGTAERSGGAIIEKACAMRIAANLPHDLWNEIVNCVVYF